MTVWGNHIQVEKLVLRGGSKAQIQTDDKGTLTLATAQRNKCLVESCEARGTSGVERFTRTPEVVHIGEHGKETLLVVGNASVVLCISRQVLVKAVSEKDACVCAC